MVANATSFKKNDPRINRKGRPRDFDALRALAQQIAHEQVKVGTLQITVVEAILRQWAQSKNPQLQRGFLEIAYGKVPDEAHVTLMIGNKPIDKATDTELTLFITSEIAAFLSPPAGQLGSQSDADDPPVIIDANASDSDPS